MHRSIEAMYIKTAHFSPHLDMQSYPVTLKNGKCPQNITLYPNDVSMQIWSKYISTRCSDKMKIGFFLPWVGYFGIVFGIEKSSHICI